MEIKRTSCLTCHRMVEVQLVPYENGHRAICPECKKLAYEEKEVVCLSCKKTVLVELYSMGGGFMGQCPDIMCGKLAYVQ